MSFGRTLYLYVSICWADTRRPLLVGTRSQRGQPRQGSASPPTPRNRALGERRRGLQASCLTLETKGNPGPPAFSNQCHTSCPWRSAGCARGSAGSGAHAGWAGRGGAALGGAHQRPPRNWCAFPPINGISCPLPPLPRPRAGRAAPEQGQAGPRERA